MRAALLMRLVPSIFVFFSFNPETHFLPGSVCAGHTNLMRLHVTSSDSLGHKAVVSHFLRLLKKERLQRTVPIVNLL